MTGKGIRRILPLLLLLAVLAGCSGGEKHEKLHVVTTVFPIYDWTLEVLGEEPENAELELLLDAGTDLHSYQPSVEDIVKISTCDLFIYVGGESDAWVSDALAQTKNPDMVVLNLLDILGDQAREEETVEGMTLGASIHEEEGEPELDEHVWLSLRNAEVFTDAIAEALCGLDPDRAETYRANGRAYGDRLRALDEEYTRTVAAAAGDTLLFGDRFPFRYLVEDYGLRYYAAFSGCSAETEASFETVAFLSDRLREEHIGAVCVLEGSDGALAETILKNAGTEGEIITLDSIQSAGAAERAQGRTYLHLMEENRQSLERALNAVPGGAE